MITFWSPKSLPRFWKICENRSYKGTVTSGHGISQVGNKVTDTQCFQQVQLRQTDTVQYDSPAVNPHLDECSNVQKC